MINKTYKSKSNHVNADPGYEYRSAAEVFGWPLVHITKGYDPNTGKPRVSKGIIAIGEIAIGVVALGGFALGGIAIGGMGVGLFALGGLAMGAFAAGGASFGIAAAIGGLAYSLQYAIGVFAHAPYVISPFRVDGDFLNLLSQIWLGIQ